MAIAIKQIMLITRNVQFAIDVKRALEALGEYSVTTVADLRNAMETLRESAHHLVLLDTNDLALAPEILIEMIRSRQAGVAIVLAPDRDSVREVARAFDLQGVVDIPVMARRLLPILERAMGEAQAEEPPASEAAHHERSEDTVAIESLVGDLFQDEPGLNYTRRRLQASLELLNPRAEETAKPEALELLGEPNDESDTVRFRYVNSGGDGDSTLVAAKIGSLDDKPLAAGMPGGTIKDLAQSLAAEVHGDAQSFRLPSGQPAPNAASDLNDSAAFQRMLDSVLDESTALENLTLESLFDTTRELPGAMGEAVTPAWLRETEKFIREPSFLPKPESLPALKPADSIAETTAPADLHTEPARSVREAAKPSAPRPVADNPVAEATQPAWEPLSSRDGDPLRAQLALTMTRVMSDLTADATVLTRGKRIVGFTGDMALAEFRALRRAIADDWEAKQAQSRIRFVKLPSGDAEFMLCTRDTVGGHCMTLIFAGDKSLSDISAQGDRMLRALNAAPTSHEPGSVDDEAQDDRPAADAMQPFAFVWIVADPALALNKRLAEQLVFWLEVQLNSLNWRVHRLDVHQDFISLFADAPARASPDSLARAVMERSRKIACSEDRALPADLWADAYLVLQPGRDMEERELREFLRFARA